MIKNQQILRTAGTVLFIFILCVIFVEPLRTRMNNIFTLKDRGELKEEEVIGSVAGYNPRVKETQGVLRSAGFYSGPADGFMGLKTRKAIKRFQEAKGLQVTGRINQMTFLALNRQGETAINPVRNNPATQDARHTFGQGISNGIKSTYLPQEEKQTVYQEVPEPAQPRPVKQIQSALTRAKFYHGKIDGIMGAKTKKAIKDFQRSKGLKIDGVVGPKTWEKLKKHL